MYNVSEMNLEQMGLQAACQKAFDDGCREGNPESFIGGFYAGYAVAVLDCERAGAVENVWFNGDWTIALFADGTKEKVRWSHEPGSSDDREKAVMACILKHVLGNGYLKALQAFVQEPECEPEPDMSPIMLDGSEVEPMAGVAPVVIEGSDDLEEDGNGYPACGLIHTAEQDELEEMFGAMPDEPGFGTGLFEE